jgi:ribosomal protein L20A (L18A)
VGSEKESKEMQCPKKLYALVSRKAKTELMYSDILVLHRLHRKAVELCEWRNEYSEEGASDWRIETYVKGG